VSVPVGQFKAKLYLCEPNCLTIFFLKEIASGEKKGKQW